MKGPELREARKAAGLTQARLAARWGVSTRTIERMEQSADLPGWVRDALAGLSLACAGGREAR